MANEQQAKPEWQLLEESKAKSEKVIQEILKPLKGLSVEDAKEFLITAAAQIDRNTIV